MNPMQKINKLSTSLFDDKWNNLEAWQKHYLFYYVKSDVTGIDYESWLNRIEEIKSICITGNAFSEFYQAMSDSDVEWDIEYSDSELTVKLYLDDGVYRMKGSTDIFLLSCLFVWIYDGNY